MDKSDYNMKAEKIQKQVKLGDYETAAKICDGIDWTQVRSARMLSLVSSVYEHVQRYDTAIDILLMAYEEAPVGRRFLYKLTELAIAAHNIPEAEDYYKSYLEEAGDDNQRYILRYKIAEAKHEPTSKKIAVLEAYKKLEFDEQWAEHLAELYAEAGRTDECVKLCDEIILWFGVGTYVDKAMDLKEQFAPLTEAQLDHRENRYQYEENLRSIQESMSGDPDEILPDVSFDQTVSEGQPVSAIDETVFNDDYVQTEKYDTMTETRRISDKDEFSHTRVFSKIPAEGAEAELFKTVSKTQQEEPEAEEPVGYEDHPAQMEFYWGPEENNVSASEEISQAVAAAIEKQEKEAARAAEKLAKKQPAMTDRVVFVATAVPSEAMEQSVEALRRAHLAAGTELLSAVKISAVKLNGKGLINSLPALKDKDLIILGASALSDDILGEIRETVLHEAPEKFFVFADSKQGIERARMRTEDLEASFAEPEKVAEEAEPEIEEIPASTALDETEGLFIEEPEEEPAEAEEHVQEAVPYQEELPAQEPEIIAEAEPEEEELPEILPEITPLEEELPEIAPISDIEDDYVEEAPAAPAPEKAAPVNAGLSIDEFFEEIKKYMKEIDCVLEEGADDEIKKYLAELKKDGEIFDKGLAQEMVEDAADEAESHNLGNMFHSRYDEEGNLILRPRHFV